MPYPAPYAYSALLTGAHLLGQASQPDKRSGAEYSEHDRCSAGGARLIGRRKQCAAKTTDEAANRAQDYLPQGGDERSLILKNCRYPSNNCPKGSQKEDAYHVHAFLLSMPFYLRQMALLVVNGA